MLEFAYLRHCSCCSTDQILKVPSTDDVNTCAGVVSICETLVDPTPIDMEADLFLVIGMPLSAGDVGDVPLGVLHVVQVHVPGNTSKFTAVGQIFRD